MTLHRLPFLLAALCLTALSACVGVRPFPAPAPALSEIAHPEGFRDMRFHSLDRQEEVDAEISLMRSQIAARIESEKEVPNGGVYDALVLSGGGPDGAFGAGLLNGWTKAGDRPEFSLVTGISTGALIAPFAFLGPEFDPALKRFYTETRTEDLVAFAVLKGLLGAAGLTDTTPIRDILRREITPVFVARIAAEHFKGRRLWVGTTNLDSQRPVIWDIGAIAATARPDAPRLIRNILLASASIPGAFPPVIFQVQAEGERFSEMHVDGGVTRQLFLFPIDTSVITEAPTSEILQAGTVYTIRNSKLGPEYAQTEPGIVQIAARSVQTLLKAGGISDIEVVRKQAQDANFDVKVIAVPDSFNAPSEELFDVNYMRALYDVGETMALDGIPWE
ncbi:MAG: patatin-like phospholipase family protein [Pseudomonadota bacterium]